MGEGAGLVKIQAFRLTRVKYAQALDGAGAARGTRNRWNRFGEAVVYAASSRGLALLEMRVHSVEGPPADAVISVIELTLRPQQISRILPATLPEGWDDPDQPGHCQVRGSNWYRDRADEKLLVVPSVVVPAEVNYVIRGGIPEAVVTVVEPVKFDPRLWRSERSGEAHKILTVLRQDTQP